MEKSERITKQKLFLLAFPVILAFIGGQIANYIDGEEKPVESLKIDEITINQYNNPSLENEDQKVAVPPIYKKEKRNKTKEIAKPIIPSKSVSNKQNISRKQAQYEKSIKKKQSEFSQNILPISNQVNPISSTQAKSNEGITIPTTNQILDKSSTNIINNNIVNNNGQIGTIVTGNKGNVIINNNK